MAGDDIAIAPNALLMIHNAWGVVVGNRHDLAEVAAVLTKVDAALALTYANRTGKTAASVHTMMDDETWFDGKEALAAGFATELLDPFDAKARFDLSVYNNAPEHALNDAAPAAENGPPLISSVRDVGMILRDAGVPRAFAKRLAAHGFKATDDRRDADAAASDLALHIVAQACSIQSHFNGA
jgi:hypothetical protein